MKVVRHAWEKKNVFFLGTKLYFPQKTPKEYLPEDIYPFLKHNPDKAPYFEASLHYKLHDQYRLERYAPAPWHVAVY